MRVTVQKIGQFSRMIHVDGKPIVMIAAVNEKPGTSPIYEIQPDPASRVILENTMLAEVKARGVEHTEFQRHRL